MPSCAVPNCKSRSNQGFRLFRFPADATRRGEWTRNTRRTNWEPNDYSRICEVHFEECQFKNGQKNKENKLVTDAVPTLFDVPNLPRRITRAPRKSIIKKIKQVRETTAQELPSIQRTACKIPGFDDKSTPKIARIDHSYCKLPDYTYNGDEQVSIDPTNSLDENCISGITENEGNQQKHEHSEIMAETACKRPGFDDKSTPKTARIDHSYCKLPDYTYNGDQQVSIDPTNSPDENYISEIPENEGNQQKHEHPEIIAKTVREALVKENEDVRREIGTLKEVLTYSLEEEVAKLTRELETIKAALRTFLNEEQIKKIVDGKVNHWSNESIIRGLKLRLGLSVHGYEFLRDSGYPAPAYSTLNRRIQNIKLQFGIFDNVLELLKHKIKLMSKEDRYCVLSYDEMIISDTLDYDKNSGVIVGHVTLGDDLVVGDKIFLVVVRGIRNPWKQAIACHVTPKKGFNSKHLKNFILKCITAVEESGLYVTLLSSDLDGRNRSLWTSLGIQIEKNGVRNNSFDFRGHAVYVTPDVWHILKNLKSAMLRQSILLPAAYVEAEHLPTNLVSGDYVKLLWEYEINNGKEIRRLYHLRASDIDPSPFEKMNVGPAIRFFSLQTASALEIAVEDHILDEDALSTAHFIRKIYEWYSLLTSKVRKTSITSRNSDRNYIFLHGMIELFNDIVFEKGWKPLNYAGVLATLSFTDIAEILLANNFDFILGSRFTQDATENIFSQIRRKAGKMPSALQSLTALRLISIAQFVSDVKRSNYCSDSDEYLLDFCSANNKENQSSNTTDKLCSSSGVRQRESDLTIERLPFEILARKISQYDIKTLFHIAGSTTNAVLKKPLCANCVAFLSTQNLPDTSFFNESKKLSENLDRGGLRQPCKETFQLILNCAHFYNEHKDLILQFGTSKIMSELVAKLDGLIPKCKYGCELTKKLVHHFTIIRSYGVKNFSENTKKQKANVFGSASLKQGRK